MTTEVPLSMAQRQFWFLDQLEPGNPAYHLTVAWRIQGELNELALAGALCQIVVRHPALRTTILESGGLPVAGIGPPSEEVLVKKDIPEGADVHAAVATDAAAPFDLAHGPLYRAVLYRVSPVDHVLMLTVHHIIADGWSLGIVQRELSALYARPGTGTGPPAPGRPAEVEPPYAAESIEYWAQTLRGAPPVSGLRPDRPRPAVRRFRGERSWHDYDPRLARVVSTAAAARRVTPFMLFLSALAVASEQEELVVGVPLAGRWSPETEAVVGMLVNTVPIRIDLRGNPSAGELLDRVRVSTLGAYDHGAVPQQVLVRRLAAERVPGCTPLFQMTAGLRNMPRAPLRLGSLAVAEMRVDTGYSPFDLTVEFTATETTLSSSACYRTDLYDRAGVRRFTTAIGAALPHLTGDAAVKLDRIAGAVLEESW